ncbi:MAG: TolC family protein [Balneolales bacterium]
MHYIIIKITKSLSVITLLMLVMTGNSAAQNSNDLGTLSLDECIEIAQNQSPVAQAIRSSLVASEWQYESYRADLLPSLTLRGDSPNFNKNIFSNTLDDGTVTYLSRIQSEASTSLAIDQNISATGGSISLSSGVSRLGMFSGENSYLWQSTPLVVGLQQPLFQFNNLKWRKRIEPLQFEISQKEFVGDMEELAIQVTQNFFNVYLSRINLENAEFNVMRNDSIYNISRGRYNVGSIAENDLLQTELQLRNAESALTTARIEYHRNINNFKILLGYSTDVHVDLEAPHDLPSISVEINRARELAIQNNSEALDYQMDELEADRRLAQAKGEGGFSANIRANFGLNQTSANFGDLYNDSQNSQFFTIGFDIPIYNWGKQRSQVNAALNEQRAVATNIEYQRSQFLQEVDYRVTQFLQLEDQVALAAQSDTIAQHRYDVTQNRYLIGRIDITNLFIAQNEKDSARQGYIGALRDFWIGWYSLRQLTLYDFLEDQPITYNL